MEYIDAGLDMFYEWLESMKIIPVIKSLRQQFEDKKEEELKRFTSKFKIDDKNELAKITGGIQ